ncbi:pyruvate kinase [Candidatus Pacearchaeota archaeon]|jgi:pyruvate kinase|nr:pyruvate kinase [Candidatus Pacearchaeota archaeon]
MHTKIIATIGPASLDYEVLKNMKKEGMNICRINTKHGDEKQWTTIYRNARKVGCEILFDINNLEKIEWVKKCEFDYIAVSYAKDREHIRKIKKLFLPKKVKIIAKIETKNGLKKIDEIIDESFGVMVARGDLSKNISYEKVPIEQKLIIKKCNAKKKFVITATEMLLSLMNSKSPERSEISDIANAIFDGSDAIMLSEETAIGKYPSLSVKVMENTIKYTEKNLYRLK